MQDYKKDLHVMWSHHKCGCDKSLLSRWPSNLTAQANGRPLLLRNTSGGGCKPCSHEKCTCMVFAVESKNPFYRAQCGRWFIATCIWCSIVTMLQELFQIAMSSAYSNDGTDGPTSLTIPLKATANVVTLNSDACGIPFCWRQNAERILARQTWK
jgi:hypothetical protein